MKTSLFKQLEEIAPMIPAPIYWLNRDCIVLGGNQECLDAVGASGLEDVVGKTPYQLYPHEIAKNVVEHCNRVMQTKQTLSQEDIIKDLTTGEMRSFVAVRAPIFDDNGEVIGVVGTSIETTAEKQARQEAERLRLENQLQKIVPIIPAPIYWVSLDSVVLGANQLCLEAMGAKVPEDVIGKTPYQYYPYEIADNIVQHVNRVIRERRSLTQEDVIRDISTGQIRSYSAVRAPIFDDEGKVIGVVGSSIETTVEKQAQEEAERLKLENEQNRIIQQEKFEKIVGQMIHDIQSPVFSLNAMLMDINSKLPENSRNILRTAVASITDITGHLLNRYKNVSAIEDEQKQPILVSEILLQIISEKRYAYKDKQIMFEIKFAQDSEFSFIQIEPIAFRRMLSNLINNAVEVLEDKSDSKVELCLAADHKQVIISIRDNGKGMSQEIINKIMENVRFSEGKIDGHGLGLMQVMDTVKDNDGGIDIDSEINSGTTIIVKFPRIPIPIWIADEIKISKDDIIIVLDDDESIHYAWDDRFKDITDKYSEIQVKHFRDGVEAINFINGFSDESKENIYLLTDFELLEQKVNGIDVIVQTKVKRTLLVTSYYTDSKIRDLAINSQIKLLPKNLAFAVRLEIA